MVVISVVTMGAVRLGILIRYCGETATMNCSLSSIILPGIGNAVFIVMIMGWVSNKHLYTAANGICFNLKKIRFKLVLEVMFMKYNAPNR